MKRIKKHLTHSLFSKMIFFMLLLSSTKASALFGITYWTVNYESITIKWDPHIFPDAVEGYYVFYYDAANSGTGWIAAGKTGGKSFTIKPLISNHCYHIKVEMRKKNGSIDTDETIGSICTSDSEVQQARAPYNLIASPVYKKTAYVNFAYHRPPNGMYIDRFYAYAAKEGGSYYLADAQYRDDLFPENSFNRPMILSGLTPNTKYYVYIAVLYKSSNGFIQDLWQSSNPINFITDPDCVAPKKFQKVAGSPTSVMFEWANDGQAPYKVRRRLLSTSGTWGSWVTFTDVYETTYNFTGLLTGRTYQFQAGITCTGANGSSSDIWATAIQQRVIPTPLNPTNFNIASTDVGYTKAVAKWTGSAKDANRYAIEVKPTTASVWDTIERPAGPVTIVYGGTSAMGTISDLLPNSTFDYRIRSINADGYYAATGASSTTNPTISTLTTIPPVLGNAEVHCQEAIVSWTHMQNEMKEEVRYREAGSGPTGWQAFFQIDSTNTTRYSDITGLKASTEYEWQVEGYWQASTSTVNPAGQTVTPIPGDVYYDGFKSGPNFTTPAQCTDIYTNSSLSASPINLQVVLNNEANNYATFSWENGSGTTPNSYELQYRRPGGAWLLARVIGLSFKSPQLENGVVYEWQVRSVTVINGLTYKSPYVVGSSFNTGAFKMGIATVTGVTQTSISFTATTAVNNVGADFANHFEVRLKDAGGTTISQWSPVSTFDNAATSFTYSGNTNVSLSASTVYGLDVRIVSNSGTASAWVPVYDLQSGKANDPVIRTMCAVCDPDFDAGNTRATATVFNPFTTNSLNVYDRIQDNSDVDWFSIQIPVGNISFRINLSQSYFDAYYNSPCINSNKNGRDFDLYLYNSAGSLIQSSKTNTYYVGYYSPHPPIAPSDTNWVNIDQVLYYNNGTPSTTVKTFYIRVIKKSTSLSDARECYLLNYEDQTHYYTSASLKTSESLLNLNGNKLSQAIDAESPGVVTGIKIFPNPATNKVTTYFDVQKSSQSVVTIINTLGQKVYTEQITTVKGTNKRDIDVSKFANGTYLVTVQTAEGVKTTKLVVSH